MATSNRDVNFVIRAKNEAGKAFDSINKALDTLSKNQEDLGSSSQKLSTTLDAFSRIATTVSTAYTKIATESDKAASTFKRQESALSETKAAYQSLTSQMESAQRVQRRMASFVGPVRPEDVKRISLVNKAYEQLSNQATKLSSSIRTQQGALQQSFYSLQQIDSRATGAADALRKVEAAQKAAGDAAASAAKKQEQEAAALERTSQAAQRRSALELRRGMGDTASAARDAWRASQAEIKALTGEMARSGQQTSDQIAKFERLRATASANKTAYQQLQMEVARYVSVLRNQGSTQEQIASAQQRAKTALQGAQAAMVNISSSSGRAASGIREVGRSSKQASEETNKLDQAMTRLFSNSRRSLSYFQRLRGEVLALITSYAGLYAAIEGVNRVIKASISIQTVESRLNVVTGGDAKSTAREMQWTRDEADRLGISLEALGGEWSQFAVASQASNFGLENARKVFMSVAEAGRVLKMDSTQLKLSFLALTQMMSKGVIQMEELRRQLGDHLPGAFTLMAEAAGVSVAELTKMMERGELTSDYLLKFADVLNRRFGSQLQKSLRMVQAEIGRFQTQVLIALDSIAKAGVLDTFTESLRKLQEMLKSTEAQVWFDRIGASVGGIIKLLSEVLSNLDYIAVVFVALGTVKGVAHIMAMGRAIYMMTLEIRTARTAAIGLGTVMSTMGGPISIAIGLLAGAFALLSTRISETDKAAKAAQKTSNEISQAYNKGARSAEDFAKSLEHLTSGEIDNQLRALKKKLDDALSGLREPFGRMFMTRARGTPFEAMYREINDLVKSLRSGQISVTQFKSRLDEVGKTHPQFKRLADNLIETAEGARESETELRKFEAQLRLMRGEATEADRKLLDLVSTTEDLESAQVRGAAAMEKYSKAMAGLAKHIPDLQKAAETEAKLAEIRSTLQAGTDSVYEQIASGAISQVEGEKLLRDISERAKQAVLMIRKEVDDALLKAIPLDSKAIQERIIQIESGGDPSARAKTSSATGIAQFTERTWLNLFDNVFPDLAGLTEEAKLALRTSAEASRKMLDVLTRENQGALVRAGFEPTARNTYLAHFLGSGTAIKVLVANPDEIAANVVGADQLAANKGVLGGGRTVQELLNWAQSRMGGGAAIQSSGWTEAETKAAEAARKHQETIKGINSELDKRIALIGKSELEAAIYNETTAKGIDLQSDEGKLIAEKVRQIWEAEKATKAGEEAEKRVNDLLAYRKELQEQIKFNKDQGNFEAVARLEEQLDGVNSRLREAIDNAVAFYEALSGEKSEIALARLQGIKNTLVETNKVTLDAKAINQSFASGVASAFQKAGDAIGAWIEGTMSGKEAITEIGNAFRQFAADFLRQIAQMIIQQMIFNMLQNMSGGGIGGFIAGLFHQGGIVGSGGSQRAVNPAWFNNAVRYHTGGIAGLRPNEVPAILEKGEEVLTANDPRHVANGGSASQANVKVVNAIDSGSFISAGLNTDVGQQAILNYISANPNSVKAALGIT